jgi:hypothetical protein
VPEVSPSALYNMKSKKGKKKLQNQHNITYSSTGTPVRKRRFKDLIWGRAAQHMQATTQQVDPLMKIMREEAKLIGTEMMEDTFGERYTRKNKWEAVEHARQQERLKIKRDKALEKATALL